MSSSSFIVIETKCGSTTPRSVWVAFSETDYVNRVLADAARCDTTGIETAEQAAAFDAERHAQTVEFINEIQFNEYAPESLSKKVLAQAERLGWYEQPDEGDAA